MQPLSLDLYGHDDGDFGTKARYFLPNMAAAQARLGDRPTVHMLSTSRRSMLHVDGVDVVFHRCVQPPRWAGVNRRFARQLSTSMVRAIRRDTADIVHFHGCRSIHTMYAAVAWRCREQALPLVGQDHGPRPVRRIEASAQLYGLRRTDALLAANLEGVESLVGLGVDRSRIELVPNGVDGRFFYPAASPALAPSCPFRVLVVSRLWEDKDPLTMADGLCALSRRGHSVVVTIISRGPLKEAVLDRLRAGSVPVTFIDQIPQAELGQHYRSADALVLTSLREGFNQATIEAMACGLPVVATDIPGIREGVGAAGILIPNSDASALADALERLIRDHDVWRAYGRLGAARASQFGWDEIACQLHRIYADVIERTALGKRMRTASPT